MKLSFHPDGFVYFNVPKPPPRPTGKYTLKFLSYAPNHAQKFYYYVLVAADRQKEFDQVMAAHRPFNINFYGTVIESGRGEPPEGTRERLITKYGAVLE